MSDFTAVRTESLVRYLARHTSGEVRFDETSRRLYATDASHYQIVPLGVVLPKSESDLIATVQIAAELNVPITARGGGTSLSGQSIGPGIVIDCSKYLNRIGEIDTVNRTVRVQPGVVLDQLNRELAKHGLLFGPDVATANRATLGGMIGNNSAGSHSIVYGKTVDHVRSLNVVLSDGTPATFGPLSDIEYQRKLERRSCEGEAYRTAARIAQHHADEIELRFPKIVRRVSGYNLPSLLANPTHTLAPLIVGSEGTLAVLAGAELAVVPLPKHRGLLVPHFETLRAALDCLALCMEFQPSAVELLDKLFIDLARKQRSLSEAMASIHGHPAALFMVEFSGDDAAEVNDRVLKLVHKLKGASGLMAVVIATDRSQRDSLWNLRSAAVPLLYSMPGDGKPVTFCEDTAVSPEKLPEFADRFRAIFHKHGTDGTFYGHASVGCLHIRPVLNLHDPSDIVRMRAIMTDVTDLVLEFGGSLSGEHGDGLVRSEWNRKMFGDAIYTAFGDIKRAFDPNGILNPGKVVNAPRMEENLRLPPGVEAPDPPTVLDFGGTGGFFRSIELCNGAGVCRKTQGGAMCPSFRATLDERDSTRGRANALRLALQPPDNAPAARAPLGERWLYDVMDLCLSCKACKTECPSNVDLAKLKAEFLQAYFAMRRRPLGHLAVKNIDWLSPLVSRFAGLSNWFGRRGFVRRLMQATIGIDKRRPLPEWHSAHVRNQFGERTKTVSQNTRRVILLDDCFTTFQEPQIGRAAIEVLERAGYAVELAGICCGRAMISKGFLKAAKQLATQGIAKLAAAASKGVPILGLEPSCLLTLSDEWPELVPGDAAKQVAAAAELIEVWLSRQIRDNGLSLDIPVQPGPMLFHGHCHQKALVGVKGTADALRLLPGAEVTVLDAGCCGMAGAFGYEREHYDLSVQIANLSLLPSLKASPTATVVANGTSCRHQIRDLSGRMAVHPIELFSIDSLSR